jgi:hypothetical protein
VPLFFIRRLPLAMLFLNVAGASGRPIRRWKPPCCSGSSRGEIRGQVLGAQRSLVVAAAPLGAAFGGMLLQYLPAPLVIAIFGLACIVAGLGWARLTVTASVGAGKPVVFRQGIEIVRQAAAKVRSPFPKPRPSPMSATIVFPDDGEDGARVQAGYCRYRAASVSEGLGGRQ